MKSRGCFRHKRRQGKRICPRCQCRNINLTANRYRCKKCRYKFDDFTGTCLGKIGIPPNTIAHLLCLFSLGVPAYIIRFYTGISLKTTEHAFRAFREAICDSSMANLRLSGRLELRGNVWLPSQGKARMGSRRQDAGVWNMQEKRTSNDISST